MYSFENILQDCWVKVKKTKKKKETGVLSSLKKDLNVLFNVVQVLLLFMF